MLYKSAVQTTFGNYVNVESKYAQWLVYYRKHRTFGFLNTSPYIKRTECTNGYL